MNDNIGVELETQNALKDVYDYVVERGTLVKIEFRKETDISRDSYNSIKLRNTTQPARAFLFKAYPLDFNPTEKQMEKAGITETTDVIAWIPTYYFIEAGFDDIDVEMLRSTFEVKGVRYGIKDHNTVSMFGDVYLYYTFGLECLA